MNNQKPKTTACHEDATAEVRVILPAPTAGAADSDFLLGDYRLKHQLGSGGSANVFLAEQVSLKREVALKVLHRQHLDNPDLVRRFHQEAQTAAQLNHPGIVQIHSVGREADFHYFAMELVRGESVKERMIQGRVSLDWSLMVAEKVAEALDYAWQTGHVVHRDVKPENIMIRDDGAVKLADFGLAASATEIVHGEFIEGSPHYIAPEPVVGAPVDFRSDVYSLGATLYHMVTGFLPFVGDGPAETAYMHVDADLQPASLRNPKVPARVCELIGRMMAKNPKDRHQSYAELITEIRILRKRLAKRRKSFQTWCTSRGPATIGKWCVAVLVLSLASAAMLNLRHRNNEQSPYLAVSGMQR